MGRRVGEMISKPHNLLWIRRMRPLLRRGDILDADYEMMIDSSLIDKSHKEQTSQKTNLTKSKPHKEQTSQKTNLTKNKPHKKQTSQSTNLTKNKPLNRQSK